MALPATEDFAGSAGNMPDPPWTQFRTGLSSHLARNGSGLGTIESLNVDSFGTWNADTPSADQYSQVVAQFTGPGNGSRYIYLVVRASGNYATGDWYWFWSDGGSDTIIGRINGGGSTNVLATANSTTFTSGDTFKFEVTGTGTSTQLKAYKNGSAIITVTDNSGSALSSGTFGVGGWANATLPLFDSWEGGNVSSGTPAGLASEADTALAVTGVNLAEVDDLFYFGDPDSLESSFGGLRLFGGFVSGGSASGPVGLASETDTAVARTAVQIRAAGIASETDTALSLSAVQLRATGLAVETDTALALVPGANGAVGVAVETDTALALGGVQILAVGLASETDAALTLSGVQARAAGVAVETDTALARAAVQLRAAGLATEADSAFALTPGVLNGAGLAVETDSAFALAGVQRRAAGLAVETDSAFALGTAISGPVGLASESDVAFALLAVQRLIAGVAVETDSALALESPTGAATYTANSRQRIGATPAFAAGGRIGPQATDAAPGRIGKVPVRAQVRRIGPRRL